MAARPVRIAIIANAAQAKKELNSFASTTSSFGDKFKKLGRVAAAGLAVAGAAGVKLATDAVKAASDAQQSLGATEAIFEKYANGVVRQSKRAADSVGLSANSYREYSNLLGALFKNQGVALSDLSGETSKHLKLAADLSAMYGGPVSDSVEALTAAYKGEFNQLEKYGVTLKQATINTEAEVIANRKYGKALKDLAPQQQSVAKQLATQRLLFKQTSDAQGTFRKESNTLAGQQQRLRAELENISAEIGTALLPLMTDLAKWARAEVVPALKDFAKWVKENQDEISKFGDKLVSTVVPALKSIADVLATVVRAFAALPGPVKEFAFQIGLAAIALPKLRAALVSTQAGFTTFTASATDATKRTALLGSTAKNIAGVGGLLALTSGFSDAASEGLSFSGVLKGAAGGAGIGAMFGPIGALIGAGAGAGLTALTGAFKDATSEAKGTRLELMKTMGFKNAEADAQKLSEALRGVISNYGKVTRAAVEASFMGDDGKLDSDISKLRKLGVSMDTIVSATLGRADAQKVVDAALEKGLAREQQKLAEAKARWLDMRDGVMQYRDAQNNLITAPFPTETIEAAKAEYDKAKTSVDNLSAAQSTFDARVRENTGSIRDHNNQMQRLAGQLGITLDTYKKFPKAVRTQFEAKGLPQTSRDALRLIGQYKGLQSFKNIKAVVSAPGVDLTKRQVEKLQQTYKLTDKQVRTLFRLEGIDKAKSESKTGGNQIKRNLEEGPGKAKMNPATLHGSIRNAGTSGSNIASSAGHAIGSALGSGLNAGITAWIGPIATTAAAAVRRAEAAARAEAQSKSPSRVFAAIGDDLMAGLDMGMKRSAKKVIATSTGIMGQLAAAFSRNFEAVEIGPAQTFVQEQFGPLEEQLTKLIGRVYKARKQGAKESDKHYNAYLKKLENAEKAHVETAIKGLTKYKNAVRSAAATLDEKLAGRAGALAEMEERLTSIWDLAKGVRETFSNFGSVVGLGERENAGRYGFANRVQFMLEDLRKRAAEARKFNQIIQQLLSSGLNATTIQQLVNAGPEAGLAAAEAIAEGGAAAINEINVLTADIAAQGQALGNATAPVFYAAGQAQAQALASAIKVESAAIKAAWQAEITAAQTDLVTAMDNLGSAAADGIVTGLNKKSGVLRKAIRELARDMKEALKKAWGIKSPSRVFRDIGRDTTRGLVIGLQDVNVQRVGQVLASDLQRGFSDPRLSATTALSESSGSSGSNTFSIRLTAQQVSQLQRGREIQADLDAFHNSGGRVLAS